METRNMKDDMAVNPICDPCRRLKLKCRWEDSKTFEVRCVRCAGYNLDCLLGSATWTTNAINHYIARLPPAYSRSIFWGKSSNAGGHPLDLHTPTAPLSTPDKAKAGSVTAPEQPPGSARAEPANFSSIIELDISSNVRDHLYSIFLTHVQPVWPVVDRISLVRHPPTVLLEAAILGVGARQHAAIASWRDFRHIQKVIEAQLRQLLHAGNKYKPMIQTVQALLIMSVKFELFTHGHDDLQKSALYLAVACKMARDLRLHVVDATDSEADAFLKRRVWAACVCEDTNRAAIFGQMMNISNAHLYELAPNSSMGRTYQTLAGPTIPLLEDYIFFSCVVSLYSCLRLILRVLYGQGSRQNFDISVQAPFILQQINHYQSTLAALKADMTESEWKSLHIILNNVYLSFISGLRLLCVREEPLLSTTQSIIHHQSDLLVYMACQTLEWATPELLDSPPGSLNLILYPVTKALMFVVDILKDADTGVSHDASSNQILANAVASARLFMDYLLKENSWSCHWTQGNTLKAILARLDQRTLSDFSQPNPEHGFQLDDMFVNDFGSMEEPFVDSSIFGFESELLLSRPVSSPVDWENLFSQCKDALNY